MIIKHIPKAVTEGKFTGFIELKRPTFSERYEMMAAIGLKIDKDADGKNTVNAVENQFQILASAVDYTKKFYKKVELTSVETGTVYSSFDELSLDAECDEIISEIANLYMGGFRAGKISTN